MLSELIERDAPLVLDSHKQRGLKHDHCFCLANVKKKINRDTSQHVASTPGRTPSRMTPECVYAPVCLLKQFHWLTDSDVCQRRAETAFQKKPRPPDHHTAPIREYFSPGQDSTSLPGGQAYGLMSSSGWRACPLCQLLVCYDSHCLVTGDAAIRKITRLVSTWTALKWNNGSGAVAGDDRAFIGHCRKNGQWVSEQ